MIERSYSPPFQSPAPQRGPEDAGRVIKELVDVQVKRSNEVSFAVESFGCDGKPVLSMLRGLACETDGRPTVAGTKNGMPFRLGAELPRGLGSAIRGAGGGLVRVTGGVAMRTTEWVLYDNVGNHWSLDRGATPVYLGETPPLAQGDGVTPAVCVQAPKIRPYELRWEYPIGGGDPVVYAMSYFWGGAGFIEDVIPAPVIVSPVAYPYSPPSSYWRIEQWIPDETTAPTGGESAAAWPGSKRHVDVEWYPGTPGQPHDWDAVTENSIDVIVSKYAAGESRVYMNQFTRPMLEHVSPGGIVAEDLLVIAIEHNVLTGTTLGRITIRDRSTGALVGSAIGYVHRTDHRHAFTPYKTEGWILQDGVVTANRVTVRRYRSRSSLSDPIGSGLGFAGSLNVTLPVDCAHAWTEPVWFRVGQVSRMFGRNPRLTPLLPRWR